MRDFCLEGKASYLLNENTWFYGSYLEKIEYRVRDNSELLEVTL